MRSLHFSRPCELASLNLCMDLERNILIRKFPAETEILEHLVVVQGLLMMTTTITEYNFSPLHSFLPSNAHDTTYTESTSPQ